MRTQAGRERGQNATLFVACFNWLSRLSKRSRTGFRLRYTRYNYSGYGFCMYQNRSFENGFPRWRAHEKRDAVTRPDEKRLAKRSRSIITIKRTPDCAQATGRILPQGILIIPTSTTQTLYFHHVHIRHMPCSLRACRLCSQCCSLHPTPFRQNELRPWGAPTPDVTTALQRMFTSTQRRPSGSPSSPRTGAWRWRRP